MASSMALGAAIRQIRGLFDSGRLDDDVADGQLLDRYLTRRDPLAFEALVVRHGPMVRATCRALVRDPHDVDDAFQATFLALVRKGGTVRGADTLGGWLHRVAHRVAVRANVDASRRRDRERRAGLARSSSLPTAHRDESIAAVHDELARLPDRFRLPVVLCHLEGKTHAQAAHELGWGEATVRRRLAGARDRLRHRLTRRGLAPAPALLALARPSAPIPPAGFGALARFIAAQPSAGPVAALASQALRSLALSHVRGPATLAAALIATVGLGLASNLGRTAAGPPAPAPVPRQAPEPPAKADAEAGVARGVVLGPDGRPVAGATIRGWEFNIDEPEPAVDFPILGRSDASGRFKVRLPAPGRNLNRRVVAEAAGFGLAWTDAGPGDLTLALAEDTPIEGRILDMEGRAVAGAEVGICWLGSLRHGVESFLASVRADPEAQAWLPGDNPSWMGRLPGQPSYLKAGADGRFRLVGLGRDRLVEFVVRGPGIAEGRFKVLNRAMDPVSGPPSTRPRPEPLIPFRVFGSTFDFVAEPSRPVEGVVRDRGTGRPLAGVRVTSPRLAGKAIDELGSAGAITDEAGRFTLLGLRKAPSYPLAAIAPPGSGHLNAGLDVADTPGLGPIRAEILATAGIPFRIRPGHALTGEPVEASVAYYPLSPNPHVKALGGGAGSLGPLSRAARQPDGSYAGVALPGPGAICVGVPGGGFLRNRVDPWAFFRPGEGPKPSEVNLYGNDTFLIVDQGVGLWFFPSESFADIALIDPGADSGPIEREATLHPSLSVAITVLGPDDKPLPGVRAWALDGDEMWSAPQEANFRATRLDPARPRKLILRHDALKLAAQVAASGMPGDPVSLRPWATLSGRLVDAAGNPRPGLMLYPMPRPLLAARSEDPLEAAFPGWTRTDAQGRFRLEALVPGLRHGLAVMVDGSFGAGSTVFEALVLEPGEARDLGDVRTEADRPAKPLPAGMYIPPPAPGA